MRLLLSNTTRGDQVRKGSQMVDGGYLYNVSGGDLGCVPGRGQGNVGRQSPPSQLNIYLSVCLTKQLPCAPLKKLKLSYGTNQVHMHRIAQTV